jgi:hypothetical protein
MKKKSLEQQIQELEDIQEIENLLGKWAHIHQVAEVMVEEEMKLWARKTPGARRTFVQQGPQELIVQDGVASFGHMWKKEEISSGEGVMGVYPMTTPVIEVAGDGKTAKAILIAIGAGTSKTKDGKFIARWHWVKAAYDLVREDGEWKLWHYRLWEIFCCPYEKSWVDSYIRTHPDIPLPIEQNRTPNYPYSTVTAQVLAPVPPEPYETFDKKTAYIY